MLSDYKKENKLLVEFMEEELSSNPFKYIDKDDGELDFDLLEQHAMERLLSFIKEDMSKSDRRVFEGVEDVFKEEVLSRTPNKVYRSLEVEAREIYRDSNYYRKDPWGYHGINHSDFL